MPACPEEARFLAAEERIIASKRLASQNDGDEKTNFSLKQFTEALSDTNAFLLFTIGQLAITCSPVLTFASLIIK